MSQFIQKAIETKPHNTLAWLGDAAKASNADLSAHVFPTRKTENWKYTSLRALENGGYAPLSSVNPDTDAVLDAAKADLDINDVTSLNVVFIDGVFCENASAAASEISQSGAHLVLFSHASDAEQVDIKALLSQKISHKKHVFASLNTFLINEGVFLRVPKNTHCKTPIRIVHINTQHESAYSTQARALVSVETGAQATVIEQFLTVGEKVDTFVNAVSEFMIADNAKLIHYRFQQEQEDAIHIGALHFELQRHSQLDSFHLALGGKIKRIDIDTHFNGEGGESKINGIYLPKHDQHIDYHTCTEHRVPHCVSAESFRGIIGDSAQAVFNGRIHIYPDAQKTLAELSNKNLLLSDKAQINTKPELEIYADDVKCAHGATVAQLNDESLHYMTTRGIGKKEAKVMLSFGFINELLNEIESDALATYLRPLLTTVFAKSPDLIRHLT